MGACDCIFINGQRKKGAHRTPEHIENIMKKPNGRQTQADERKSDKQRDFIFAPSFFVENNFGRALVLSLSAPRSGQQVRPAVPSN